ncbi:MAG: YdhR family protein [Anaerolineales bacterium]
MPVQILLVTFKLNFSPEKYVQVIAPLASDILNVPGLRWKIWLINVGQNTAGGIYLFDDESYTQAFLTSPLMATLKNHSALANLRVRPFDVMQAETSATHGPLGEGVRV